MTYVLKAKIGDVNPQDVEFKNSDTDSSGSGNAEDTPTDSDTADETPDMDDFEPDSVSPPAKGESIDEISERSEARPPDRVCGSKAKRRIP